MRTVTVDRDLQLLLRLCCLEIGPLGKGPEGALDRHIEGVCAGLLERWRGRAPGEIEALGAARQLYRSLGIDPTKTRPSSEALLRRLLRGEAFPRVLPAVDVGNVCSLELMLPVGIYDLERVHGDVQVRSGRPGEGYAGIRKQRVNLEGRIAVCDAEGPFGNPTSDSARTKVGAQTRRLLFLIFAPVMVDDEAMARHRELVEERYARLLCAPPEA